MPFLNWTRNPVVRKLHQESWIKRPPIHVIGQNCLVAQNLIHVQRKSRLNSSMLMRTHCMITVISLQNSNFRVFTERIDPEYVWMLACIVSARQAGPNNLLLNLLYLFSGLVDQIDLISVCLNLQPRKKRLWNQKRLSNRPHTNRRPTYAAVQHRNASLDWWKNFD